MRKWIIATLVSFIFAPAAPDAGRPESARNLERIEHGLVAFTSPTDMLDPSTSDTVTTYFIGERMTNYNVPGVSVALVDQFELAATKGYGSTRSGGGRPVDENTLFQAASTSKLVVAVMALKFVEDGRLDLDEDVNVKLTSWKIPDNDFTSREKVTLRLLLTHRAGLNRPEGGFSWEKDSSPTLLQTLNGEAPAENKPAAIVYEPGSKWEYSNFGYLVIQQLLEDVAGKPFPRIAREIVFEPLGMSSSTFEVPLSDELAAIEAVPHDAGGAPHAPDMHPNAVANGGLMTTPADLAVFTDELMLAYHGRSDKLLTEETVRAMCSNEVDIDPAVLGAPIAQGLGVLLYRNGGGLAFLHPGDNLPGASSWLIGWPDAGRGIVVMTNGAMGNLLAMEITAAFLREYK